MVCVKQSLIHCHGTKLRRQPLICGCESGSEKWLVQPNFLYDDSSFFCLFETHVTRIYRTLFSASAYSCKKYFGYLVSILHHESAFSVMFKLPWSICTGVGSYTYHIAPSRYTNGNNVVVRPSVLLLTPAELSCKRLLYAYTKTSLFHGFLGVSSLLAHNRAAVPAAARIVISGFIRNPTTSSPPTIPVYSFLSFISSPLFFSFGFHVKSIFK